MTRRFPRTVRRPRRRISTLGALALALGAWLGATTSLQADAQTRFAVRGGFGVDPEIAVGGFALQLPEFSEGWRVQPSADVGFGDVTVVGLNVDVLYTISRGDVTPYAGGGLGVAIFDLEPDTVSEVGVNLVGGLNWGRRSEYSTELRIGLGDLPEVKFLFGYVF